MSESGAQTGERLNDAALEEAALALMQMHDGPGYPMRDEARVAVEAYLRRLRQVTAGETSGVRERLEVREESDGWPVLYLDGEAVCDLPTTKGRVISNILNALTFTSNGRVSERQTMMLAEVIERIDDADWANALDRAPDALDVLSSDTPKYGASLVRRLVVRTKGEDTYHHVRRGYAAGLADAACEARRYGNEDIAEAIRRLRPAHRERVVEAAYREGWADGSVAAAEHEYGARGGDPDDDWRQSDARAALTDPERSEVEGEPDPGGLDDLRDRLRRRIREGDIAHGDGIDQEPYDGAGYCVCEWCQEDRPLLWDALVALTSTPEAREVER